MKTVESLGFVSVFVILLNCFIQVLHNQWSYGWRYQRGENSKREAALGEKYPKSESVALMSPYPSSLKPKQLMSRQMLCILAWASLLYRQDGNMTISLEHLGVYRNFGNRTWVTLWTSRRVFARI